jgi:hypothetical protein
LINDVPKKLHAKKEKKLLKHFFSSEIGIRKAPLPSGTAELKSCPSPYILAL